MCLMIPFYIWCHDFVIADQETPLDCLALVASKACIPESHRNITIRKMVVGCVLPPGYCGDSRLKHASSYSVKKSYLLDLELWPEYQASDLADNQGPTDAIPGNRSQQRSLLCFPTVLIQLIRIFQKGAYTLILILYHNFCSCHQKTCLDGLALLASRA